MDRVLLRTMTWKSKFMRGKYAGKTVEEVYLLGPMKLAWTYYHVERVTFTDEVLNAIPIYPEERIEKPGINPNMHQQKMIKIRWSQGIGAVMKHKRQEKRRAENKADRIERELTYSKGAMQWQNVHGKY